MAWRAEPPLRVLDIGGGDGFLSVLLPDADYVLAEPQVNRLSGLKLPFDPGTFDVTVVCHVLEHIAAAERGRLVDQALGSATRGVLILGPFASGTDRPASEEGILEATGSPWAEEHLAHGLPSLEDLRACLDKRALRYEVAPHADARVMYWQFLALHFAALAGEDEAAAAATRFYQRRFDYRPADPTEPHDFLVRVRLT
jgi:hypothetical protein